jgi:hypothetical protein
VLINGIPKEQLLPALNTPVHSQHLRVSPLYNNYIFGTSSPRLFSSNKEMKIFDFVNNKSNVIFTMDVKI